MPTRRDLLVGTAVATTSILSAGLITEESSAAESVHESLPVRFALNMSTIRGQKLPIDQQIEVARKAGYDAVEPWVRDIETFENSGGSLKDLKNQIADAGLTVDSAIGFANWIAGDANARREGLEQAKREMQLVLDIGGDHIAAPPVGAHKADSKSPSLPVIADRYRALLDVGKEMGVYPQLELWGFSPTLSKLSELAYVATAAAHPMACVLPDFYHIYKGGNDFQSMAMIESSRMHCFHINDYPGDISIADIGDKDRVFPGDGVCDLPGIIAGLLDRGFSGTFSLELFNPEYWKRDATDVATEGLDKSKQVVREAVDQLARQQGNP